MNSPAVAAPTKGRARARDLGIVIGELTPGPLNAITDVSSRVQSDLTVPHDR